jgi:CBS domain-containing protein
MRLTAATVMTSPVTTVKPGDSVIGAAALLSVCGYGALPVVDDVGRVVGLATEADLVRGQLRPERRPLHEEDAAATVGEAMRKAPLLAPPEYDLAGLVSLMLAAGTNSVPIVHNHQLVGIVGIRDALRIVGRGHGKPRTGVTAMLSSAPAG